MFFRTKYRSRPNRNKKPPIPTLRTQLSSSLADNILTFKALYNDCSDVVFRFFTFGDSTEACLIYMDGMSSIDELDKNVLTPLMNVTEKEILSLTELIKKKIPISMVKNINNIEEGIEHISIGNPVLLMNGFNEGIALGLAKWEKRSIEEPVAETVIRGPRDSFTEMLSTNTTLLRRRIRTHKFKTKRLDIGSLTQTGIVVAYIEGVAKSAIVEEVLSRLQRIEIDGILESGYIEELIEDNPISPFPQIMNTERPDVAVAGLLEGRVVILVDNTPFVLIAPITLFSLFQSSEDYYTRYFLSIMIRWLRYLFVIISLLLPSFYIAVLTFHQEMVPTTLLESMATARERVPFPALVEAFIMEITFEALREAGLRLPKQVGAAVSIVGALVIGQAAVEAGIVSTPMVIVVSLTGIASFAIPRYVVGMAFSMLRFPIMILAGTLGLLGLILGVLLLLIHLCGLKSFGVPYMSPLGPMNGKQMHDVLLRKPWWMLRKGPKLGGPPNENI
jgi:hypothetical protein